MNLILFSESELDSPLPMNDERAVHITRVLKRSSGEPFDVGVVDGKMGKARVVGTSREGLLLSFELAEEPPPLYPIELLVGLARPQTMRRVLRDCTSVGVSRLDFFASERGEAGYAESSLWKSGEVRRCLVDGAQQAFSTRLPAVALYRSLAETLGGAPAGRVRIALDNYEAFSSLGAFLRSGRHDLEKGGYISLVVGSERGWSPHERSLLRDAGVPLVHLGTRVLRTEVACVSAVSIVLSQLGLYDRLLPDAEVREHRIEDVG